jgi:hypothetical protein
MRLLFLDFSHINRIRFIVSHSDTSPPSAPLYLFATIDRYAEDMGQKDLKFIAPYNVGIRCLSSAQSLPTALLMSSLAPLKAGAGITVCMMRIIFS